MDTVEAVLELRRVGLPLFQGLTPGYKRLFIKCQRNHFMSQTDWQLLIESGYAERADMGYRFTGQGHTIMNWLRHVRVQAMWFRAECWRYYRKNGIKWEQGQ